MATVRTKKKKKPTTRKRAALPTSQATNAYDLLTDVERVILAEPKRYNQHDTLTIRHGRHGINATGVYPRCGTVGCVAGWTVVLKGDPAAGSVTDQARKILGLNMGLGNYLFGASMVDGKSQTPKHARSGVAHIRAFKKAYTVQLKAKAV